MLYIQTSRTTLSDDVKATQIDDDGITIRDVTVVIDDARP